MIIGGGVHSHLHRLSRVWAPGPVYFITACTAGRKRRLANDSAHEVLRKEWMEVRARYGWAVGRYVVMPDHVHFFIAPSLAAERSLADIVGQWKQWSAKRVLCALGGDPPLWQRGFFDHLLRSAESRSEKWEYVRNNPVRAGLVRFPDEWPYAGAIDFE